jgi:hypothetical protein
MSWSTSNEAHAVCRHLRMATMRTGSQPEAKLETSVESPMKTEVTNIKIYC